MPRVKKPRPAPRLPDRPGRWQLLIRRQRRMLTPAGIGLAALGVLVAGLALLHVLGPTQSLSDRLGTAGAHLGFTIAQVVVEGRVKTPEPLLRAAIGATPGAPILDYRLDAARARIESINWVQAATVERRLPDTIVVRLVERRPFAVWQYEGKFRLIDRDGQVVTDSDVATFAGQLPLVVGAGAPAATAALMDALAQQPGIQARVMAAVRVGERRWNLRLKSGTDVLLPEGAEAQALAKLAELQAQHALLDRPLQAIDMRLPDRFVFRPLPAPAAEPKDVPAAPPRRPT
jgi:cell division protein FtsQ